METKHQSIKQKIEHYAIAGLILYAVLGSCYNSVKTGHPSADIATGITQPSKLERSILNYYGLNIEGKK